MVMFRVDIWARYVRRRERSDWVSGVGWEVVEDFLCGMEIVAFKVSLMAKKNKRQQGWNGESPCLGRSMQERFKSTENKQKSLGMDRDTYR